MTSIVRGTNLTYDQLITTYQSGDIVFVHGKKTKIIQALIMFATRSTFSHVFIAFSAPIGDKMFDLLVEVQGGTTKRILTQNFYKSYRFTVVSPPQSWQSVEQRALAMIGKEKYSYLEALYVGLRSWTFTTLNIRLPSLHFSKGEICSEFVASVYQLPQDVSPQQLFVNLTST